MPQLILDVQVFIDLFTKTQAALALSKELLSDIVGDVDPNIINLTNTINSMANDIQKIQDFKNQI